MSTAPLSVRINPSERALLEAAATNSRTSVSEFVRRKAIEAAELELLDRRTIVIPADAWERFEAFVNAPPKDIPAIRRLAESRPVWEE